jgi:hypothetical protein
MWFAGTLIGLIIGAAAGALVASGSSTTQTTTVAGEPTTMTTTAPAPPAATTTTAPAPPPTPTTTTPTGTPTAPTGTTTTPTPSRPSRLPAGAKDAFIGGCVAAYNYSYCLCLINELEKTVATEEELAALSVSDPRLRNAEHACAASKQQG